MISSFLKYVKGLIVQLILKILNRRKVKFSRGVILSKDFNYGSNCKIGKNTNIGREVRIGNNIKIGSDCIIEKIEIDDNSCIESRVIITGFGNGRIKVGKECYIGIGNILDWSNDITIGDYVHIAGPSTGLWTHSSAGMSLNSIPLNEKSEKFRPTAPIHIQNNVYIGSNCTIYPGIEIGHHSIVAPNSAVTKNVNAYEMVGGVPAKFIKTLSH